MVSARSRPAVCPAPRDARRRRPSSGARGPWCPTCRGPLLRSDCRSAPLGSLRLSRAPRYLACCRAFVGSHVGACSGRSAQRTPGPLGARAPNPGMCARRQRALPRSRATPMEACPALRPRGGPAPSPCRAPDGCLPATGTRRLSSRYGLKRSPRVHPSTHCRAPSRGLPPRSLQLRTPIAGRARGVGS